MHIKGAASDTTIITGGLKLDVKYTNFYLFKLSSLTLKGSYAGKEAVL